MTSDPKDRTAGEVSSLERALALDPLSSEAQIYLAGVLVNRVVSLVLS
jgi:hypothetical protein